MERSFLILPKKGVLSEISSVKSRLIPQYTPICYFCFIFSGQLSFDILLFPS